MENERSMEYDEIVLENISKKFDDHVVFDCFNMRVKKGEYVAVTGKSGKGKTTLLNIIGMLIRPDSGNVYIDGIKNPRFDSKKGRLLLRNNIAYIFQNYGLIDDTSVRYNLSIKAHFSSKNKEEDYISALEEVGLHRSCISKKIFELSGGEQQRVALAGLFLKKFNILLADEPTGSLDEYNKHEILNIIDRMNNDGKTIIVVTHDNEVKNRAGRIIEL